MALAFAPEVDKEIADIVGRYPERQAALIPVLWVAQREFGYLNTEAMELVADRLELPPAKVITTATFYTMFHKKPVGRYHLQLCRTLSCYLRGSDALEECVHQKLGIRHGETTADKKFSLEEVECLAYCGTAPVVQINRDVHENLTAESFGKLIDDLAAKG